MTVTIPFPMLGQWSNRVLTVLKSGDDALFEALISQLKTRLKASGAETTDLEWWLRTGHRPALSMPISTLPRYIAYKCLLNALKMEDDIVGTGESRCAYAKDVLSIECHGSHYFLGTLVIASGHLTVSPWQTDKLAREHSFTGLPDKRTRTVGHSLLRLMLDLPLLQCLDSQAGEGAPKRSGARGAEQDEAVPDRVNLSLLMGSDVQIVQIDWK